MQAAKVRLAAAAAAVTNATASGGDALNTTVLEGAIDSAAEYARSFAAAAQVRSAV